jgi:hypothetical protein
LISNPGNGNKRRIIMAKITCKIVNEPHYVFNAELTLNEVVALRKMIGKTNIDKRMEDFNLTRIETDAIADLFDSLFKVMDLNSIKFDWRS